MSRGDIHERHATPYPGLRPFRKDEAELFFGRGEQVEAMLTKLETHRFLAVVGASGCGKSSLVRAGLLPALEEGYLSQAPPPWLIVDLRPGDAPLDRLAEAFLKVQPQGEQAAPACEHAEAMLAATLRRGPRGLVDALHESRIPDDANVLLLVDQFEELFRFRERMHGAGPTTEAQRNEATAFVELLLQTARQTERPIYVVITMRSDFLGDCDAFLGLPEAINDGQFLAPRLTRDQLAEVIRRPAQLFGARIDEPLVNRLLNQLGNDPDQLPVLQHALMRMWTRKQAALASTSGPLSLTAEDYALTGGLEDALSRHADEAYNSLDVTGKRIAERMFRCLSDGGLGARLTRRLATIQEIADVALASVGEVVAVADAFRLPDRCFLTPSAHVPLAAQTMLDISHESLLRLWTRMDDWVRAEAASRERYHDLCRRADQHQSGGDLLGRQDLNRFQSWLDREQPTPAWAERYGGSFELAVALLRESADAIAEEAEQRRRAEATKRRAVIASLIVLAAFTAVLFVFWRKAHWAAVAADRAANETRGALIEANHNLGVALLERANKYMEEGKYVHAYLTAGRATGFREMERGLLPDFPLLLKSESEELLRASTIARQCAYNCVWPEVFVQTENDWLWGLAIDPAGRLLAAQGKVGEIDVWSVGDGKLRHRLSHSKVEPLDIHFSPDSQILAACSRNGTIVVWTLSSGAHQELMGHEGNVQRISFSPNGKYLASAGGDRTVRIWDVESGNCLRTLDGFQGGAQGIAFSPDSTRLATGSGDGLIRIHETDTWREAAAFPAHSSMVWAISFHPEGKKFASCGGDKQGKIWDLSAVLTGSTRAPTQTLSAHTDQVFRVTYSSDGQRLATASWDGTVRVWDASTSQPLAVIDANNDRVDGLVFHPNDASRVFTCGKGRGIKLWRVQLDQEHPLYLTGHTSPVAALCYHPKGRLLASGSWDKTVRLWDLRTGRCTLLYEHSSYVNAFQFNRSGTRLFAAGTDGCWVSITMPDGKLTVRASEGHPNWIHALAVSPDGNRVVYGGADGMVRVWDTSTGHEVAALAAHSKSAVSVSFNREGSLLVSSGGDGNVCLWDSSDWHLVRVLPIVGETDATDRQVASTVAPDGLHIISATWDGRICLSDINLGKTLATLREGVEHYFHALAVTADMKRLAVTSFDRTVRIWDLDGRRTLEIMPENNPYLYTLALAPDGRWLAYPGANGVIRFLAMQPPDVPPIGPRQFHFDGLKVVFPK